jgi:transcriptional regulator with XRE-family HTH domain
MSFDSFSGHNRPTIDEFVGARLRLALAQNDLSVRALADALVVPMETIELWLKGSRRIGPEDLVRVGEVLRKNIVWFFEEAGIETSTDGDRDVVAQQRPIGGGPLASAVGAIVAEIQIYLARERGGKLPIENGLVQDVIGALMALGVAPADILAQMEQKRTRTGV